MLYVRAFTFLGFVFLLSGCGSNASFNLAPASQEFMQNDLTSRDTIDILWVIDNSVSMQSSQDNLRANFDSFFSNFSSRDLNFHMAVTTTDAYTSLYTGDQAISALKNKDQFGTPSGCTVCDNSTPNIHDAMLLNLNQGTAGTGDERAFQSFMAALYNPSNASFRRNGGFLAIIILSDEDDFSANSSTSINTDYNHPLIYPTSYFTNQLDILTASQPSDRRYSVSAITIMDQACMDSIGWLGQRIGVRYQQLARETGGFVGSLCGNFADTLDKIGKSILELLTAFPLERTPRVETIAVFVNGVPVPKDSVNGWTYDSVRNSIIFHGDAVPGRGKRITVNFQPLDAKK